MLKCICIMGEPGNTEFEYHPEINEAIPLEVAGQETNLLRVLTKEDASIVIKSNDPSINSVQDQAKEDLGWEHWWLNELLVDRFGPLQEKVLVKLGDHSIYIYNFWQELTEDDLTRIKQALITFSRYVPESVADLEDIVIDGKQAVNSNNGEPKNGDWLSGRASAHYKTLRLFPNAFKDRVHRVTDKVNNLEGTIIHELGHSINKKVDVDWSREFGWRMVDSKDIRELPGGEKSSYICDMPERCVTEYARANESEDVAESFVAYICDPEKLDDEKLEFLHARYPRKETTIVAAEAKKLEGEAVEVPKVPSFIKYFLTPSRIKSL